MRARVQWLVTAIPGLLAALSVVAAVLVAVSHEDPVLTAPRGEPATTSAEPEGEDLPRIGTQNLLTQGPSTAPASLRGRPMYNACALLPETEIIAMGLRIHTFVQANSDHLRSCGAIARRGTPSTSTTRSALPPACGARARII